MVFFVFAAYLLLCMPVQGGAQAFAEGKYGRAVVSLRLPGIFWQTDKALQLGEKGWPVRKAPVFGAPDDGKKERTMRAKRLRRTIEQAVRRAVRARKLDVYLCVGMGDAWMTALAAGGAKAAVLALLAPIGVPSDTKITILPEYGRYCFSLRLHCIFSICAGDIMLAAAKAAIKKR